MTNAITIKVNFRGGIISPGDLYNILVATSTAGIKYVSFGLRQQLLITAYPDNVNTLIAELKKLDIPFEINSDDFPNIVSSYPAEEVFITHTWLSEGVYKDIFDGIDYEPRLKINLSDSNQSFTPMLTGNINWVASSAAPHFWHLFIRFPKTNTVYEWKEMVYTNDVPKVSKEIETLIFQHKELFYDNVKAKGEELFSKIQTSKYIIKTSEQPAILPAFNLPYYEGLNRYNNNRYWLGAYRRDELFKIEFLKELALLCLETKIGQLCSTPWKTIIVKGIEEKDRLKWSRLLDSYRLNMRHAANELNFQVEDNCREGLELKNYLVKQFGNDDTRTFGICIGIKTRKKSEVFSSILVKRKPLLNIFGVELFYLYDILCAEGFNPNERTGFIFSKNNPKFLLGEQLRRCLMSFYKHRANKYADADKKIMPAKETDKKQAKEYVHQCSHCLTVYDETIGEPERNIATGTSFSALPDEYSCSLCESPKEEFVKIEKSKLGLQTV
ncbi:MAG: rubredoxin [Sphingobacteriales bacterium]|nr:rubredoxin [Sphingobacteriales bacterium]MBI3717673.1 rubredoxin [Sphingobacteriales bacterium]